MIKYGMIKLFLLKPDKKNLQRSGQDKRNENEDCLFGATEKTMITPPH